MRPDFLHCSPQSVHLTLCIYRNVDPLVHGHFLSDVVMSFLFDVRSGVRRDFYELCTRVCMCVR